MIQLRNVSAASAVVRLVRNESEIPDLWNWQRQTFEQKSNKKRVTLNCVHSAHTREKGEEGRAQANVS